MQWKWMLSDIVFKFIVSLLKTKTNYRGKLQIKLFVYKINRAFVLAKLYFIAKAVQIIWSALKET